MAESLSLAIAKGRVLDDTLPIFEKAGYPVNELRTDSRRLIFDLPKAGIRLMVVRSQDVPTYVERGAADAGVVGRDVLEEHALDLYEPLDLGISRCRLVVAGPVQPGAVDGFDAQIRPLRVATKYPRLAQQHFSKKGQRIDLVHLYGAIELAPLTGIADKIVDLVDTGKTLKANGLAEEEDVMLSTARLVVGRASLRLKAKAVQDLISRLGRAVAAN